MPLKVGEETWIDPHAVLIGNIEIGKRCFIGPGVVIRADLGKVMIGDETSIQDNVVIHAEGDIKIGSQVIIGHGAIIHGNVGNNALIGMHAVVSIGAEVEEGAVVGELALVAMNSKIPANCVALGIPAKVVKEVTPDIKSRISRAVEEYVQLAKRYLKGEMEIHPSKVKM